MYSSIVAGTGSVAATGSAAAATGSCWGRVSQRDQAPRSLRDRFWDVAGSHWGRIAAGTGSGIALGQVLERGRVARGRIAARSGSRIAPGQVLGRGRIALGQDRSGIRLQDRCGGRICCVGRISGGGRNRIESANAPAAGLAIIYID